MRYAILSCIALAASLLVGWLLTRAIGRRRPKPLARWAAALLTLALGLSVMAAGMAAYLMR